MRIDRKANLSDPTTKGILLQEIAQASGWHNIEIGPARAKAHHKQFKYYYGCVLPLAKDWLNESQGDIEEGLEWGDAEADVWLKCYLRGKPFYRGNRYLGIIPPSKATFTTTQMYEFTDDVVALLRDNGVTVPPPDRDYARKRAEAA